MSNRETKRSSKPELAPKLKSYEQQLLRYLCYRLGNASDARDLAQEAYLRLIRVPNFELIRQPEAYLFKIAKNLVSEFQIKRSRLEPIVPVLVLDQEILNDTFERKIELDSCIAKLDGIIESMPNMYKTVLLMRKRDGYSHEEIANKLNISKDSVHRYLKRALSRCREQWAE